MSARIDRALDLLERLVIAAERVADRETRPARKAPPVELPEPTDTDRALARRYARRLGVVVRGSGR